MYLGFESDHGPAAVAEVFPPATLERLRAIKRRVDPERAFTQNLDVCEGSQASPVTPPPSSATMSRCPRCRAYSCTTCSRTRSSVAGGRPSHRSPG